MQIREEVEISISGYAAQLGSIFIYLFKQSRLCCFCCCCCCCCCCFSGLPKDDWFSMLPVSVLIFRCKTPRCLCVSSFLLSQKMNLLQNLCLTFYRTIVFNLIYLSPSHFSKMVYLNWKVYCQVDKLCKQCQAKLSVTQEL